MPSRGQLTGILDERTSAEDLRGRNNQHTAVPAQRARLRGLKITQNGDYPLLICVGYHRSDLTVEESLSLSHGGACPTAAKNT
jgi:hypothetical protein